MAKKCLLRNCCKCGISLTKENWRKSNKSDRHYICKNCIQEREAKSRKIYRKLLAPLGKTCIACNILLTQKNWNYSERRCNYYICTNCSKARRREIHHRRIITLKNKKTKWLKNDKVQKPNKCEICGHKGALYYHHWNDEYPYRAMWICLFCHHMAERIDKGYGEKYLKLKDIRNGDKRKM